jgi:hypothetical protein
LYKRCLGIASELALKTQFHLPPNVCQNTCDADTNCVGYTTDASGTNCWILIASAPPPSGTPGNAVYWRIGPNGWEV